jgi:hypothetical protein
MTGIFPVEDASSNMPESGTDGIDEAERLAGSADVLKDAWQRTLTDMQELAQAREAEGWETTVVAAGDTGAVGRAAGDTGQFGLVHVVPDTDVQDIEAALEGGTLDRYEVYRQTTDRRVFLVTEYFDADREVALYVAGTYELRNARAMVKAARDEGRIHTHLRTLDRTPVASFQHDDLEKFVPLDAVHLDTE